MAARRSHVVDPAAVRATGQACPTRTVRGVTTRYITHPSGQSIGYVAPEGQAWFLTDKLGSVIGLVDGNGTHIGSYSYDPTGVNRANTATGALAARNVHRYAGGVYDATTGLTRFGVRWYNPATGRFTTPDPSGKEKNNYLYAGGNSCNRTDPMGECPDLDDSQRRALLVTGAVIGAVGILAGGAVVGSILGAWELSAGAANVLTLASFPATVVGGLLSFEALACDW